MFDTRISLGNVLTLVFILGSAFATTAEIVHAIDQIDERVSVLELKVTTIENRQYLLNGKDHLP